MRLNGRAVLHRQFSTKPGLLLFHVKHQSHGTRYLLLPDTEIPEHHIQ
mgnify:CR=1 FL=1